MGKKWPFVSAPVTHSENEDWYSNYEFQKEWHPFAFYKTRQSIKKQSHAWHWWDGWGWRRMNHRRCWKEYRRTQYKAVKHV